MKPKLLKSKKVTYTIPGDTSGREFTDEHEALAYRAAFNVVSFFKGGVSEEIGLMIVKAIKDDPDGFREAVGPLLRKPPSKRGRPLGSKNKTTPNGGKVSPEA